MTFLDPPYRVAYHGKGRTRGNQKRLTNDDLKVAEFRAFTRPWSRSSSSERAIANSSKSRDVVLDSSAGSGTTLIAAEKLGRQARLLEIHPCFCDVIVRRWQDFTGKAARLEANGETFGAIAAAARTRTDWELQMTCKFCSAFPARRTQAPPNYRGSGENFFIGLRNSDTPFARPIAAGCLSCDNDPALSSSLLPVE
jgi:hypothetical protein